MWIAVSIIISFLLLWVWFVYSSKKHALVDWQHPHANFLDGSVRWFCKAYHRMPESIVPLPQSGPAIVVANHVSGLDPFILITATRRPLRFLVAREQYNQFGQHWALSSAGCIPVDRERRPEKALREANNALDKGEVVALFPHGGIHWPEQADTRIKGGAIRMAMRTGAPIYPVRIDGVGLPGYTLLALLFRSRISINVKRSFSVSKDDDYQQALEKLAQLLKK